MHPSKPRKKNETHCKPEADVCTDPERNHCRTALTRYCCKSIPHQPQTKGQDNEKVNRYRTRIGLAAALQPAAHAQFGSGIVYDPTQSGHAITQIEHEERSIANEAQQIENGQQIFTNTVKIATTALQTYNVVKQQYNLYHHMILAPRMLYSRFLSPTSDLRAATDLEYLRQFDGLAQFRQYRKRSGSRLPAGERSEYHQRDSRLQRRQRCRAVADCRTGCHR